MSESEEKVPAIQFIYSKETKKMDLIKDGEAIASLDPMEFIAQLSAMIFNAEKQTEEKVDE